MIETLQGIHAALFVGGIAGFLLCVAGVGAWAVWRGLRAALRED